MIEFSDLTDEKIEEIFPKLLRLIAEADLVVEDMRAMLEAVEETLEYLDEQDAFGTEGWRHRIF